MTSLSKVVAIAVVTLLPQLVVATERPTYPVYDNYTVQNQSGIVLQFDAKPQHYASYNGGLLSVTPWEKNQMRIKTILFAPDGDQYFSLKDNKGHSCIFGSDANELTTEHKLIILNQNGLTCKGYMTSPAGKTQTWNITITK